MAATPLAEAFVRVRALTDKFKDDVERGFQGLGDDFGKQFAREGSARLRDERGLFAAAGQDIGDAAGDAAGERFGRRMAETGQIRFGDDGAPFVSVGQRIGGDAGQAAGEEFGKRFFRDANGRLRDERGRFVSEGRKLGEGLGDGFNDGFGRRIRDVGDIGRRALDMMLPSLGRLTGGFGDASRAAAGLLGSVAKWTAIAGGIATLGAAAASSAGYVVALSAALAPVGGLLAALPGIALTGAAAFSVWKLATGGLGEAMGAALSGNAEALAAAMAKLSDGGKAFVAEFQQTIPILKEFKAAAQDAFLSQISGRLMEWALAASGLKPAISDLAREFGSLVRTTLDFATAPRSLDQLGTVLGNTRTLVGAVRNALQPLLKGFLDLGTVGSTWLAGLSGGLQDSLTTFGEWMSRVSESGQAMAWMNDALDVLKQLGRLVKDVWGIFTGLFDAAEKAGGSALGVLGNLVGAMNDWVNSAKGQETLITIFRALADIGRALLPVVTALASGIATLAPVIAEIATLVGPILTTAINALAPALAALGPGIIAVFTNLGAAVTTLASSGVLNLVAEALSAILIALAPLLPAIADLLVPILQVLAALITGVVAPALSTLVGWITQAVDWIKTGGGLTDDHPLARFGTLLRDTIMPIVQQAGDLIGRVFSDIVAWVQSNGSTFEEWGARIQSIIGHIGPIVSGLFEFISIAWERFGGPLLDLVSGVFSGILQVIDGALQAIKGIINTVVGLITGDWDRAWNGIKDIFGGVWEAIKGVLSAAWEVIKFQMTAPLSALGQSWESFWNRLKQVVTDVWNTITRWVEDKVNAVRNYINRLSEIPGQVSDWFGRAKQSIVDRWNEAVSFVQSIPGRITSALSGMGTLLQGAGRDLVIGFYNGIIGMWNWLVSQVQNLFGGLAEWAKSILGIASPSKVFAAIGREIPVGLMVGVDAKAGLATDAVARLGQAASDAFAASVNLPELAAETSVPAFTGTFASSAREGAAVATPAGGITIENITVQGVLDPSNPVSYRRMVEQLREAIRQLEREVYADA
ncbi:phage tail protein [Nonomuraea indica]|uniref:phage tail protein n=1 Tax=Nonomuraea indica TaxID=1581193 RepID=UPI000C7E731F|nr:hypothetical protein [Nonomuraea indica]